MDAHTLPCDWCAVRFEDDLLVYVEAVNSYLCPLCIREHSLEGEETWPEQL